MKIQSQLLTALCLTAVSATAVNIASPEAPVLMKRQYDGNSTANQLKDGTPCRDITVIFAKGTFEPGNVGGVVGPAFFQKLVNVTSVDQVAVQGVDYNNDVNGFLAGGDVNGSILMSQLAAQAVYQCPDTNLVLSGYSQGAQLVHNAANLISDCVSNFIASVVLFGDPKQTQAVGRIPDSKVIKFCHETDSICHGGYQITNAHLNYSEDVGTAAQFVVGHAVLS